MSRYLVTGGAGFIGSHLVDQLVSEGHHVVILDDLSTGSSKNIPHRKEVELVEGSILNLPVLEEIFSRIDGCFHLAAVASVQKSIFEWSKSHHVNLRELSIFFCRQVFATSLLSTPLLLLFMVTQKPFRFEKQKILSHFLLMLLIR